ncbi:sirohydrochlorin cobaltochelatase [Gemmiger sp.]
MRKITHKKAAAVAMAAALSAALLAGCGSTAATTDSVAESTSTAASESTAAESTEETADESTADEAAAKNCADLIDAIYVQERTADTDARCEAAKAAWDALTDTQKEMVEGENADPEYFGRDTGDASKDDPRNEDEIGENELLVVSFGTSFNDSRVADIKGIEDALQAAYPDWSVRRAFTAQIIINHVQARDGEKIDNMQQALDRAVANGVKNLIVQPTHLMHGAEYDEMCEAVDEYKDKFESVSIAEPLLGEVGSDASVINADKEAVAAAITAEAVKTAGYDDAAAAAADGTAFVFMGHGTSHTAKVSYSQMQTTMQTLGYDNVFIGTVEGEPEDTACEAVIEKVKEAGYTKVVLRPLMVVAGDHANNDMAGSDDDSWLSQFKAAGCFDSVDTQIAGLGEIADIQQLYVDHTKAAMEALNG